MAKKQENIQLDGLEATRKALVKEILDLRDKENDAIKRGGELSKTDISNLNKKKKALQEVAQSIKEINTQLTDQLRSFKDAQQSVSSLSDLQSGFKKELNQSIAFGIKFSESIAKANSANKEGFRDANDLVSQTIMSIADLSDLSREDAAAIAEKNKEIEGSIASLSTMIAQLEANRENMDKSERSILNYLIRERKELQEHLKTASKYANVQKSVKELHEEMNDELMASNKFFQKLINYGKIFFSSWSGALGVITLVAAVLLDEFGKINIRIGGGYEQLTKFKTELTAISLILGEDAVNSVIEFGARIGNVNKISKDLAFDLSVLPAHLGVSGDEAGRLVNQFGNLQGLSNQTALNTLETTSQLAAANGVIPSQVMKDLADNTELAATYATGFGNNIQTAAIDAARLGVNLSTVGKISDSLLDYQTSVSNEMEASVLLGRNLNLQKARELAYADDIDGAMRATLEAMGGINEFNKMDVFQKRAVASAIGVSVEELKQMAVNMENANKPIGVMQASFNSTKALLDTIAGNGMGKWLMGLYAAAQVVGNIGFAFNFLGSKTLGEVLRKTKLIITNLLTGKKMFAGWEQFSGQQPTTPSVSEQTKPKPSARKSGGFMKDLKGLSPGQMLASAAAIIAIATAVYILSSAFENFEKVSGGGFLIGIGAMLAFTIMVKAMVPVLQQLSSVSGSLLPAIGVLLAISLAVAGIGYGLSLMGNAFKDANLDKMTQFATGMVAFATSVLMLAGALSLLGNPLSLAGLGVLAGIGAIAGVGVALGAFGGTEANTDTLVKSKTTEGEFGTLIQKIEALTTALMAQPIELRLDGNVVAKSVRKETAKGNVPK